MRFHKPSTERSAAFRSNALSFAKSYSIGLKSGEYSETYISEDLLSFWPAPTKPTFQC